MNNVKTPKIVKIRKAIENKNNHPSIKFYIIDENTNLVMHVKENKHQQYEAKIVLPQKFINKALRITHMGHHGIHKTFQKINQKYLWQGIFVDTVNFVNSCTICHQVKHHQIPVAPFQNNPIPQHPGEFISLDIVGPFQNNAYILIFIDHFSRHMVLHPLKNISADNVVKALFDYITVHSRPALILTDLGIQFTAHIFESFCQQFGIRLIHTSIAHPQANSISERINTSIKTTIAALQLKGYNLFNAVRIH